MKQLALPLFAFDRAIEIPGNAIAFDRASVRRIDQDGHLFVETTPISKAGRRVTPVSTTTAAVSATPVPATPPTR